MVIQLIDYGHAIDLKLFPENQQFTAKIDTENFVCTEMLEGKPWTYQLDLFCLVGTIYSMLCGKYMRVERQSLGEYRIAGGVPAFLNVNLWLSMFNTLINIRNCNSMPDLQDLRAKLKLAMTANEQAMKEKMNQFNAVIE